MLKNAVRHKIFVENIR